MFLARSGLIVVDRVCTSNRDDDRGGARGGHDDGDVRGTSHGDGDDGTRGGGDGPLLSQSASKR